ncbi:hypothetical protein [Arthrobacter sp.]|uniref:hypothetical protein n=1 Tax=Arthrobacter sp. TaxID=1667 RepID=UPI0028124E7E|nr:hypothetical protein [Arthrobacter sp.]
MVRQGSTGNNGSRQATSSGRKPTSSSNGASRGRSAGPSRGRSGGKSVSAVYRRRRLFVGVTLLMVLAMGFGGFAAVSGMLNGDQEHVSSTDGGNADGGSDASPQPTAGRDNSAAAPGSPPATPSCDESLVTVTASTDKPVYGDGENPLLSLKVTNGGELPCDVNIGTSQMEFLVTSGSDRIFSSLDCQANSEDLIKTIAPGKSETANFPWPRNRSVPGCSAVSAKPGAGGAYYVFTAKLGARTSPKAVFQLG